MSGEAGPTSPSPAFVRPKPGRPRPKAVDVKIGEPPKENPTSPTKASEPPPTKGKTGCKPGRKPGSREGRNNTEIRKAIQRKHDAQEFYTLYYRLKNPLTITQIAKEFGCSPARVHNCIKMHERLVGKRHEGKRWRQQVKLESQSAEIRRQFLIAIEAGDANAAIRWNEQFLKTEDQLTRLTCGYKPEKQEVAGTLDVKQQVAIAIFEDENWYGNAAHSQRDGIERDADSRNSNSPAGSIIEVESNAVASQADAASIASPAFCGEVQGSGLRAPVGQNGSRANGTH